LHKAALATFKSESVFSVVKTNVYFDNFDIVLKKKQIGCGLAWSVLLSTMIRVITVVKMLWTREAQPSKSSIN